MGTFKVKPSAVTFTCNGISSFSTYLSLVGITTDSGGFVDLSQLCTQYAASTTTKNNMKAQLNTKFYYDSDTSKNLYNTWLYSQYPGTVPGRITVPFQDSGTSQTIILPGTTPHFKKRLVELIGGKTYTVERTASALTIKQGSSVIKTWYKSDFDDGVIPLFLAFLITGGGGGGSSSKGTYSGYGGGGGGSRLGILNLCETGATGLALYGGGGGAGAAHNAGGAKDGSSGTQGQIVVLGKGHSYVGEGGVGAIAGSRAGAGGSSSKTGTVVSGIYWWDPKTASTASSVESSPGKTGGSPGNPGGEYDELYRGVTTVSNKSKFESGIMRQVASAGGTTTVNVAGNGGGGGGAAMDGSGGSGPGCGGNTRGRAGSYAGGGGGGGGFTTARYVGGGAGGDGMIELWY